MSTIEPAARRAIALVAFVLAIEAAAYLTFVVLGYSDAGNLDVQVSSGVATFLALYGLVHLVLAFLLVRRHGHVRGAIIATQLIQLGVAWNLRDVEPQVLSGLMGLSALVIIVMVILPSVTRALHEDDI